MDNYCKHSSWYPSPDGRNGTYSKMTGEKDKATQKVEKPKQEDPVKLEETTEEVKAETPEQAFENYLVFLVDAVNSGDYTGAEKVMVKDSPLYQDQKNW